MLCTDELLEIAQDFLGGSLTPFEIRTDTKTGTANHNRAVAVFTTLASYGLREFKRPGPQLRPAVARLLPVVFRENGLPFNNEFPIYNGNRLDSRLISFQPPAVMNILRQSKLYTSSGAGVASVITMQTPKQVLELIRSNGNQQAQAIISFVRSGKGAAEYLDSYVRV